jgi:NAD(P)-dependent dehydrogenase (short-subunit alcohol dehydrogenase family)
MSKRLDGKVAVITGAASGIGAGTARMFVDHGAKVIIADMQADAGRALAAELGDNTRFISCNVTQEAEVAAAVDWPSASSAASTSCSTTPASSVLSAASPRRPSRPGTTPSTFCCVVCSSA